MQFDSQGRLLQFRAWPDDAVVLSNPTPADLQRVLASAGLDPARMAPAEPPGTPPLAFDSRVAWTSSEGRYPLGVQAA